MGFHHPQFFQWQEAERSAREAEQEIYSKLCNGKMMSAPITQEDLDRVRTLRRTATTLMRQMLLDMRETAESLKFDGSRRRRWKS